MHHFLAAVLLSLRTTHVAAETRLVRITSKILGEERVVHVSLPPNYSVARRRYETTYLLDGQVRHRIGLAKFLIKLVSKTDRKRVTKVPKRNRQ